MNPLGVDKVICLCLDKREKLWHKLESQCLEKGWDFKPFICGSGDEDFEYNLIDSPEIPPILPNSISYPSWFARHNAYSAWKSHRAMMKYSLEQNYNSVLFLEDDTIFCDNPIQDVLMDCPWDMFYLGWFGNLSGNGIHKVNGNVGGWHAVALKKHIMEQLVEFPPIGPFDWICQQEQKDSANMLNCYAINPTMMRQKGTFSFVEGHYLGRREEDNYQ